MEKYKISVACIIECKKKFLMVKEEQSGRISWDILAGGIELHETLDQAVLREVEEETGLKIEKPKLKEILIFQEKKRTTVNFLYYITIDDIEKNQFGLLDADIIKTGWFSKLDIEGMLSNQQYEHEMAKKKLQFIMEGFDKDLNVIQIYSSLIPN